jgi:hypothetical protein
MYKRSRVDVLINMPIFWKSDPSQRSRRKMESAGASIHEFPGEKLRLGLAEYGLKETNKQ